MLDHVAEFQVSMEKKLARTDGQERAFLWMLKDDGQDVPSHAA
jgi:hypothetical protein